VAGKNPGGRHSPPAEQLYQQLDMLQHLRQTARRELLAESRKHAITAKLRQIPSLGPIRSSLAVALIQTPHRFRTKRQLWTYSGLGLETRDSGEYYYVQGQLRRRKKQEFIRGLNKDRNHDLKGLFKAAATRAGVCSPNHSRISTSDRWPKVSSPPWRVSRWHARLQPLR
jgi:transposase